MENESKILEKTNENFDLNINVLVNNLQDVDQTEKITSNFFYQN